MYSLRNIDGLESFHATQIDENYSNNICRYTNYGPTFGYGYDFYIADNARSNTNSYANFGQAYNLPPGYTHSQTNTQSLLAGDYHFTPSELEVLYLN